MDRVLYTLLAPIATGVLIFLKGAATDYRRRSKDRARKRKRKRQRVAALRLSRSQEEIEQQVAALRHLPLSEIERVFGITDTTPRREESSYSSRYRLKSGRSDGEKQNVCSPELPGSRRDGGFSLIHKRIYFQ